MVGRKHISKQKGSLHKGPEVKARLRDRKETSRTRRKKGECSGNKVEK